MAKKAKKRSAKKVNIGLKSLMRQVQAGVKKAQKVSRTTKDPDVKKKAQKAVKALRRIKTWAGTSKVCPFLVAFD